LAAGVAGRPRRGGLDRGVSGPAVQVIVGLSTLLGSSERSRVELGPATVDFPASMARLIAADPSSTWQRLVNRSASAGSVDCGPAALRPPTRPRPRFVARARDHDANLSEWPIAEPSSCDSDHVRPVEPPAVETNAGKPGAACRRHHHLNKWRKSLMCWRAADASFGPRSMPRYLEREGQQGSGMGVKPASLKTWSPVGAPFGLTG